jgi:hypothetical protein
MKDSGIKTDFKEHLMAGPNSKRCNKTKKVMGNGHMG